MHGADDQANKPDLTQGIALSELADGTMLLGHVNGEPVLLARRGGEVFAIGATCTHSGGPLAEGLIVGNEVRCPWHHACFSLRTGEATRAPALDGVKCWRVEQRDGKAFVAGVIESAKPRATRAGGPAEIVIIGGGAAGSSAAETLRREGYAGGITMISADESLPCDRPLLSKGFLAGTSPESSVALRTWEYYAERRIELILGAQVASIETAKRQVELEDGRAFTYDALLLATGADPVRLTVPGADLPHVHYLRTLADCRSLVAKALTAKRALVVGASFIGLEAAASLRARGIEVDVVAPSAVPMEKVLGPQVGAGFQRMHEQHGVRFHMGTSPASIDAQAVTLANGERVTADLVVVGIGVRPALALAEQAGLAVDRGVSVNEFLETSVPGIFAAGDIARWPDPLSGERIRVEHWAVAQRQGATAARNMLGRRERFTAVPFFWTEQYDFSLVYVGHAERFDEAKLEGDFDAHDCTITYSAGGKKLAVATVYRDHESLRVEAEFEDAVRGVTR
jgi:NADPH-dependent 2,4-dienoyl-CoA reductase/sulfur reductase-like enzyme/nitrite reductase/ring-hydroxylating ferredoxin subunit